MYKKLGVLLSASVLATAGLVPLISNSNNVQAGTIDTVKDNSKLNYDDNEPIDSWMPDKYLQEKVLETLKYIFIDVNGGSAAALPYNATVKDITKKDMLNLNYSLDLNLEHGTHLSLRGLEYASNLQSISIGGNGILTRSDTQADDISLLDVSSLNNLPKLENVRLISYGIFDRNSLDQFKALVERGVDLQIYGEYFSYLKDPLRMDENNYKELSVSSREFINIPDGMNVEFSAYGIPEFLEMNINGKKLKYSETYDQKEKMFKFKLLTKGIKYSDVAGKSVVSMAAENGCDYDGEGKYKDDALKGVPKVYCQGNIVLPLFLFNKVEFAPENQNISDLTELYNKVKYSISYSGDMFNSQPGNSMKYKNEFNDKTMFGAMDYAYNSKDYDGLVKLMHDSVKKTHESIGSLQVNEVKAKELGLNVDQLKSDLAKDSVPYDYSQDNDIDGINKQLDSIASVRAKYNKLVQQGVFDKSDYWTMNK